MKKLLWLVGPETGGPDGVRDYSVILAAAVEKLGKYDVTILSTDQYLLKDNVDSFDIVQLQYPTQDIVSDATLLTRLVRKIREDVPNCKLSLTLHEWSMQKDSSRKEAEIASQLCDTLIFPTTTELNAYVRDQHPSISCHWIPIGVNIENKDLDVERCLAQRKIFESQGYDLIMTNFGGIYQGKDWIRALKVIEPLKKLGHNPLLLFVGKDYTSSSAPINASQAVLIKKKIRSILKRGVNTARQWGFFGGKQKLSLELYDVAKKLGCKDNVLVTGFVADHEEVKSYVGAADLAFAFYEDGLTVRRGSFWFLASFGMPCFVSTPLDTTEFEKFNIDLSEPRINFVDQEESADHLAQRIHKLPKRGVHAYEPLQPISWDVIAEEYAKAYDELLGTSD